MGLGKIKELGEIRNSLTGMDLVTDLAERASTAMSKDMVEKASGPEEQIPAGMSIRQEDIS